MRHVRHEVLAHALQPFETRDVVEHCDRAALRVARERRHLHLERPRAGGEDQPLLYRLALGEYGGEHLVQGVIAR